MYRARADAVSGTRVYAGGKWLQCIGNKNVSVGDYVWTDGRCVYGHLQESEQPKVITTQEDEGIPIMFQNGSSWDCKIFAHNKLRLIGEYPRDNKWSDYSAMINDAKGRTYLYDNGTHYKEHFYGDWDSLDYSQHFYTDAELIATNIDKFGNRFDMIRRYESVWRKVENEEYKEVKATAIEILKNGEVTKTIPLQPFSDEVNNDCPAAKPRWTPEVCNLYFTSEILDVSDAFIEDDKTWCFWIYAKCVKETLFNDDLPFEYYPGQARISDFSENVLLRLYLVTNDGNSIVSEDETSWDAVKGDYDSIPKRTYWIHTANDVTFPIQDGYYCKAYDMFDVFDGHFDPLEENGSRLTYLKDIAHITFYSPKDQELFTGIFGIPASFNFCRVKSRYLLDVKRGVFVYDPGNPNYESATERNGVPVFQWGIHFGKEKQWEKISNSSSINQRFRPMKKAKNWYKRIQPLEIEQQEI